MKGGSPEIIKEVFRFGKENGYNLRYQNTLRSPNVSKVNNGTETVSSLGPKIWELILTQIKELVSLNCLRKVINKWKPANCPCRLCKPYIHHVGFIS